ncbi:MAG: sigma 54-interacting transcriptional regulator [Blastocatellia bacterium]
MRIQIVVLFLCLMATVFVAGQTTSNVTPQKAASVVVSGATLIDVRAGVPIKDSVIVIEGDRIKQVGKSGEVSIPSSARIIDARGKWIIPGLTDMHSHISGTPGLPLGLYLANGVTTIRDPGGNLTLLRLLREQLDSGKTDGPRLFFAGPILDGNPPVWPAGEMIGTSRPLTDLMEKLVKIAESHNLSVFITGETGVGKEVVARQIHQLSERSGHFRAVNCAAMAESLLESELFGHEKGAFTGAHAVKKNLWEEAAQGTLFLDEITEASPALQAKLLRVLQEGTIRRVGSNQEIKVTARVIAASNRNIEKAIADGSFREDLFYPF